MKSICLNLSTRPDRWQLAQHEFSRIGLTAERFEPLPHQIPYQSFNQSQAAILGQIDQITAVFEDDVKFINEAFWPDIMADIPFEFDILYLGGNILEPNKKRFSDFWWHCTDTWTTHAVIYTPSGAEKILDLWQDRQMAYDEHLRRIQPQIKAFICKPFLAIQRADYSDLQGRKVDYTNIFSLSENNLQ